MLPGHPDGMAKISELVSLWFEAGDFGNRQNSLVELRATIGVKLLNVSLNSSRNTSWNIHGYHPGPWISFDIFWLIKDPGQHAKIIKDVHMPWDTCVMRPTALRVSWRIWWSEWFLSAKRWFVENCWNSFYNAHLWGWHRVAEARWIHTNPISKGTCPRAKGGNFLCNADGNLDFIRCHASRRLMGHNRLRSLQASRIPLILASVWGQNSRCRCDEASTNLPN